MSRYIDEEYFEEPTEFEVQITESKASLAESLKEKVKEKIHRLEKENAELREYRDLKEEHERIIRDKVAEYDRAIQTAKVDAMRTTLKTIFGENLITAYRVHSEPVKFKKCDRCNSRRRIEYKTPLGKTVYEDCVCSSLLYEHIPKEVKLVSFTATNDRIADLRHVSLYYERTEQGYDYDRYDLCGEIYKGEAFEKVNAYRVVFFDIEECTKYCEWLNKNKEKILSVHMNKWGLSIDRDGAE